MHINSTKIHIGYQSSKMQAQVCMLWCTLLWIRSHDSPYTENWDIFCQVGKLTYVKTSIWKHPSSDYCKLWPTVCNTAHHGYILEQEFHFYLEIKCCGTVQYHSRFQLTANSNHRSHHPNQTIHQMNEVSNTGSWPSGTRLEMPLLISSKVIFL